MKSYVEGRLYLFFKDLNVVFPISFAVRLYKDSASDKGRSSVTPKFFSLYSLRMLSSLPVVCRVSKDLKTSDDHFGSFVIPKVSLMMFSKRLIWVSFKGVFASSHELIHLPIIELGS